MKVTIKDVAKEAGVSPSTVSRVLTQSAPVEERLKKPVWAAVEKLDYRPNAVARSLRLKKTLTLGVIVPDIRNPYFPDFAEGVEATASRFGYNIILCSSQNHPEQENRHIQVLWQKQVDGLIFMSVTGDHHPLKPIVDSGIPVVVVGREVDQLDIHYIAVDNVLGAEKAVHYLFELGHRRIATIAGPKHLSPGRDRMAGYRNAMAHLGLQVKPAWIERAEYSPEAGYEATRRLLRLRPIPTAIFASSDVLALGAVRAVFIAGLRVPEDVSIVSFDNSSIGGMVYPGLTAVAQPMTQMGEMAVDYLVNTEDQPPQGERILIEPRLVIRESAKHLS